MREIKYRGKTVSTKEWVCGDLVHNAFNGHRIFPVGIQIPGCYPDEVIAETVGQFTGLHDKNGKELYEGDVIRSKNHHPEKMEIRFIEGGFCAWWGSDDYPIDINHFYDSKGCCFEVIGNIHENPELLEGRE